MKKIAAMMVLAAILLSFNSCLGIKIEFTDNSGIFPLSSEDLPFDDAAGGGLHRHFYDPADGDSVKLSTCVFDGCFAKGHLTEDRAFLEEISSYLDYEHRKKEILYSCNYLMDEIEKAEKYDEARHGYSETSALYRESDEIRRKFAELDGYRDYASDVMNAAYIFFVSDPDEYYEIYREAKGFYSLVDRMTSEIKISCYESAYREYVFREEDGRTAAAVEEEIQKARATADDKTAELKSNVSDLLDELAVISDPASSERVPEYMEKVVEANNALARYLGYDNYFEYALKEVYSRDYDIGKVNKLISLVKEYFTPLLWYYQGQYQNISYYGYADTSAIDGSFFDDADACDTLYGFLKRVEECQTDGVSYYESANSAILDGRAIKVKNSGYITAFTTFLKESASPVMCFSESYGSVSSFVHEHGHSFAHLTGSSDDISLDVNEIQSQAAELLYVSYLEGHPAYDTQSRRAIKAKSLFSAITSLINSTACSEFEKVLYTGDASGIDDPEGRLADGVTSDEYDYLYKCILGEYDIAYGMETYWRTAVPAHPCYYLSYAVSMIPSLELYVLSEEEGLEAGVGAYLSLFDFQNTDEYRQSDEADIEFVCNYIGVGSPFEEETFISLSEALSE
ncbi:MAG: hypothetical protein IJS45_00165 [Clostridia bacterium]|nr:hypothetical protein [Clostridia bacterium]